MTRTMLKATTALTVSLSLIQPGPVMAQRLVGTVGPLTCLTATCAEREWRVQSCTDQPALEGCIPEAGTATDPTGGQDGARSPPPNPKPSPR